MGLTRLRAEQISDIDYKQAVRVITITNVTLSGGAPSQVDGVNLSVGDRILVNGQDTGSQNGIYQVQTVGTGSNGTWIRSIDTNQTGELEAGTIVMVTEGTTYKDTQWKLTTNNPIIIGTTALTFEQNSAFAFGNIVANTTAVLADSVGGTVTFSPGSGISITGNNTSKTVTITATGTAEVNSIANGTSNVAVVSSGGNVTIGIGGTSNVVVFSATNIVASSNLLPSANVTYSLGSTSSRWKDLWVANSSIYIGDVTIATVGSVLTINGANVLTGNAGANLSTTGNVIGGNITTTGLVTATGNVTGGNISTTGLISATGNITTTGLVTATGNVTGGNISTTGNVIGGNITTTGLVTATGNVTGGNISTTGLISATGNITTTGLVTATGNVTGGNISTTGLISATGNITGNFIFGNGSQLTGIDATSIQSGTSNVRVVSSGGNVATGIGGTSNVVVVATTGQFVTGVNSVSGNITGGNILTAGTISATGNVTGNFFIGNGSRLTGTISWVTQANTAPAGAKPGDFWYDSAANVKYQYINDGTSNVWVDQSPPTSFATLAVTGNTTSGNLSVSTGTITVGNIVNANGNGIGNIGSASLYFNTAFIKATSAQYADLAEMYTADADYVAGTVVEFGGSQEITQTTKNHTTSVAGVISTNPSYLMNSTLTGTHVLPVALTGRVPCRVVGIIRKGDRLVASNTAGVATVLDKNLYEPGCIIGKALENYDSDVAGVIEIAVGRY